MKQVLKVFHDIFAEPEGLPPSRGLDHVIPLVNGSSLINPRPYSYPYFQKKEIEHDVKQKLDVSIIQPRSSPFASPVLLVIKNDGTWRICGL